MAHLPRRGRQRSSYHSSTDYCCSLLTQPCLPACELIAGRAATVPAGVHICGRARRTLPVTLVTTGKPSSHLNGIGHKTLPSSALLHRRNPQQPRQVLVIRVSQVCKNYVVKMSGTYTGKIISMQIVKLIMSYNLFIYLFKISDRRTRGPLILSEEHRNT